MAAWTDEDELQLADLQDRVAKLTLRKAKSTANVQEDHDKLVQALQDAPNKPAKLAEHMEMNSRQYVRLLKPFVPD